MFDLIDFAAGVIAGLAVGAMIYLFLIGDDDE